MAPECPFKEVLCKHTLPAIAGEAKAPGEVYLRAKDWLDNLDGTGELGVSGYVDRRGKEHTMPSPDMDCADCLERMQRLDAALRTAESRFHAAITEALIPN